jgi:hypothetical protein
MTKATNTLFAASNVCHNLSGCVVAAHYQKSTSTHAQLTESNINFATSTKSERVLPQDIDGICY